MDTENKDLEATQKDYAALVERAEKSVSYWSAEPIAEYIDSLCRLMEARKIKRAELARRLGTSRAYVTKLLGGNVNFTLTTMVKIAMAIDGAVHTHVADKDALVHWIEGYVGEKPKLVRLATEASTGPMVETYVLRQDDPDSATVMAAVALNG